MFADQNIQHTTFILEQNQIFHKICHLAPMQSFSASKKFPTDLSFQLPIELRSEVPDHIKGHPPHPYLRDVINE